MYIGNDLQIAHPSYKIIDDISSGFNGSTTSFALQVNGATPVPFPISTQQVMISVNGVVQEPDPSGSAGFKLLGSNIVFSSAPANGHAFFGVINAGADYVTAGSEFPDGSATAPSFTFQDDQDTGWFRSGSGAVGYSANGVQTLTFDGNGLTVTGDASFVGDSAKNLLWDKSDGALEFADSAKAVFGTGSDLNIYHDSTSSYIDETGTGSLIIQSNTVQINNSGGTEIQAKFIENGAVELYYNNFKSFLTDANGIIINGPEGGDGVVFLNADEGDDNADQWRVKADTSGNFGIDNYSTGSWVNGLTLDGSNNATFAGNIRVNDSKQVQLGTGSDTYMWHDGSNGYFRNTTGSFYFQSKSTENAIRIVPDGEVALFHNDVQTFETNASGITVQGPEGGNAVINLNADEGDDNADKRRLLVDTNGDFYISNYADGAWEHDIMVYQSEIRLYYDNSIKLQTTATGVTVTGAVSDSKGNLRDIPVNGQSSQVTLATSDIGKVVATTSGGWVIPNSTFSNGNTITLLNDSSSDQTINASALGGALYNTADGSDIKSSTITLGARTMATIWFGSGTIAYIQAANMTVS